MEYVRLGSTGMKVSRICLGCMSFGQRTERWPWALDEEDSRPFIKRAPELGISFFDTANAYSDGMSEVVVGRALKDFASRDEIVPFAGLSASAILLDKSRIRSIIPAVL